MKRLPIPTSPAERSQWLTDRSPRTGWLILSLLLSLVAGFSGSLVAREYQIEWLQSSTPDIVVVPNTGSTAAVGIVKNLQNQQAEAIVLVMVEGAVVGNGVVLSSDGWVATTASLDAETVTIETLAGKRYTSDAIQVDARHQVTYIHLPSTGLHVAQFRETELALGESLVAYLRTTAGDAVAFTYVASVLDTTQLDRSLPERFVGAALYDSNESLIGFATSTTEIVPITVVNAVAFELFSTGEITTP